MVGKSSFGASYVNAAPRFRGARILLPKYFVSKVAGSLFVSSRFRLTFPFAVSSNALRVFFRSAGRRARLNVFVEAAEVFFPSDSFVVFLFRFRFLVFLLFVDAFSMQHFVHFLSKVSSFPSLSSFFFHFQCILFFR